ncbi:MAG: PDZ domain-containing protein, partial [Erysipelotrichaceae bacterium]|nr:PDZ domain-containing protein [Erysipelotrichaceae bacterium]
SIIADAIIADEPLSKLQMGISGRYLCDMEKYETVALNINVETVSGYYVDNVRTNSLGSRLGLQRGDIIISINGIPVEDRDVMLQILYSEINEIELVISRNGEESTLRGSISRDD